MHYLSETARRGKTRDLHILIPPLMLAMEKCMVRREIASRIVVVCGLVCANVSDLFVETSSWP
jgi:hypothetical protein